MYDSAVHIHASAPTRIDLAGGTLDIWPLYLFHDGAQTLNAAISLRAQLRSALADRSAPGHRLGGLAASASRSTTGRSSRDSHDLRLLGRLLHYFQAEGLELHDAVRFAGRRRHRRVVGAEHRRVRRAERLERRATGPPTRSSRSR